LKLVMLASAWTFGSLSECIQRTQDGVFDGIEGPPPERSEDRAALRQRVADGLLYLGEACTGGDYAPPSHVPASVHFADLERALQRCQDAGAFLVNCLSGSDSWSIAQSIDFFGRALELARSMAIEICFETHRGRPTFHPGATRQLLDALPAMQLTCDFSHWCVVCERLVDDEAALALAFERARHVHARVGYAQGPQVPHPRAPEFASELARHEAWWSAIWFSAQRRGLAQLSMTPEFGPDGYLHHLPFTNQPVADLAEINTWMASQQRARFRRQMESDS
jgi:hypothetical protein